MDAYTKGIDVSHDDGPVDWQVVMEAGDVTFAYCKIGEGKTFTDPRFAEHWPGMRQVGITRGGYYYIHPGQDAHIQAARCLLTLGEAGGSLPSDLPLLLDLETDDGESTARVQAAALAWCEVIAAATGRDPDVYTYPAFAAQHALGQALGRYRLHIAHYGVSAPTVPAGWADWAFWQYGAGESGAHPVPGVGGSGRANSVDVNWYHGSHADLVQAYGLRPVSHG